MSPPVGVKVMVIVVDDANCRELAEVERVATEALTQRGLKPTRVMARPIRTRPELDAATALLEQLGKMGR